MKIKRILSFIVVVFILLFSSTSFAWLGGWDKRVKLTLDHNVVDSDLSDFPIFVYLSIASGIGDVDVSAVFDEVGANWQKIAIANDSDTEMYIEKVSWDDVGETAELWVKLSAVASGSDSEYYLYYDNDHADNTTYIKAQGDATDVWDSNFKMVQHLNDLTTSTTEDSTSNSNDGTKKGANEPVVTTSGQIGSAQTFDGTNDYLTFPINSDFQVGGGDFTIESWIDLDTSPGGTKTIYYYGNDGNSTDSIVLSVIADDRVWAFLDTTSLYSDSTISIAQGVYIVFVRDGSDLIIYIDGEDDGDTTTSVTVDVPSLSPVNQLGRYYGTNYGTSFFGAGYIDEFRFSKGVARSAAWIKASYNSGNDSLVTFGSEEESVGGRFIPQILMH